MNDRITNFDSPGALDDMVKRLIEMLKMVEEEVIEQVNVWSEYQAICCQKYSRINPMAALMSEATSHFATTCMMLGYLLAKKPHELEGQLMELRSVHGTTAVEELMRGDIE